RLRAVRVRTVDGQICESIDIRNTVGIEMEFEVLVPGHVLVPNFHFYNQEGSCVFIANEHDEQWRRKPRPAGHYVSTAWIPGNLLAEGALIVGAAVSSMEPLKIHFFARDIVAFQVIDSLDGTTARGDYAGPMPGIVRPLLNWTSQFTPAAGGPTA
ncbi:MAG TPA: hypothetical protein VHH35_11255, partial [Pyrinomonadaceae bacterium]|nr:hypothetical protein [Pyrinomonadaceae bacterium]